MESTPILDDRKLNPRPSVTLPVASGKLAKIGTILLFAFTEYIARLSARNVDKTDATVAMRRLFIIDLIKEGDLISIHGLKDFAPNKELTVTLKHTDGSTDIFKVNHTYNAQQIEWFKAGSALNNLKN